MSKKIRFNICELYAGQTIHIKCQALFSQRNTDNVRMLSAAILFVFWTRICPVFANSADPDQLASSVDLHCLSLSMWICINNLEGVVGCGEGVMYPGRPTNIVLQLGKACYPCSR